MWRPEGKSSFSNHETVESRIQRGRKTSKKQHHNPGPQKSSPWTAVQRSAWKTPVEHSAGKRPRQAWWFCKYHLLQDKQQNKQRLTKELLTELIPENETHRRQQQGQVTGEKHRGAVCVCRYGDRKAKAHPKLHLVKQMEGKKKGCCGCIWVAIVSWSWRTRLRPPSPWALMVRSAFQSRIQIKDVKTTQYICVHLRECWNFCHVPGSCSLVEGEGGQASNA